MKLQQPPSIGRLTYFSELEQENRPMSRGFWSTLFKPHDGTRAAVIEEVKTSRESVQHAATRFEVVVNELLERNDRVTGRKNEQRTAQ